VNGGAATISFAALCIATLKHSFRDGTPGIRYTDEGRSFTSKRFTGALHGRDVGDSMDERGLAMDTVSVEGLLAGP
jgi:hypothetical protein